MAHKHKLTRCDSRDAETAEREQQGESLHVGNAGSACGPIDSGRRCCVDRRSGAARRAVLLGHPRQFMRIVATAKKKGTGRGVRACVCVDKDGLRWRWRQRRRLLTDFSTSDSDPSAPLTAPNRGRAAGKQRSSHRRAASERYRRPRLETGAWSRSVCSPPPKKSPPLDLLLVMLEMLEVVLADARLLLLQRGNVLLLCTSAWTLLSASCEGFAMTEEG